jgi:ribosomal protein L37AE/L43A
LAGNHDTLKMKLPCPCGHEIYDGPDQNPNIGHLIPDQDWFRLLDTIDAAIEGHHPTAKDKEAACMSVRCLIGDISRRIWQCSECGRLWINDRERQQQGFTPVTEAGKKILRGHKAGQPDAPGS